MTTGPPPILRPEVLVLEVNETLSDLEPMRERFEQVGLPGHALDAWFAATLRDGFALTAAGTYPAFRDVASGALRALLASTGSTRPTPSTRCWPGSPSSRRIRTSRPGCTGSTPPVFGSSP